MAATTKKPIKPKNPPPRGTVEPEVIAYAAVRCKADGLIYAMPRPARHSDILHRMSGIGLSITHTDNDQGFVTSRGVYMDRVSAKVLARERGQLLERAPDDLKELYTEDLW